MTQHQSLWDALHQRWPTEKKELHIGEITTIVPKGTAGIDNQSSYDYAILALLATSRKKYQYLVHLDQQAERVINEEAGKLNRKNDIWKEFLTSKVARVDIAQVI